ncbi:BA14K family protein [Methylobacterium sp. J-070]|uniref:BA14K family protein n=1 Tax=Methylobacterium sp. J-070 TaxID=2836650 RepID=UPI001FBA7FB4|nr:BA14K family protein [Methylobacterium sp. J-070]MCJ2053642.1 BA14K family protein [Methylobacterium sp. J-070]
MPAVSRDRRWRRVEDMARNEWSRLRLASAALLALALTVPDAEARGFGGGFHGGPGGRVGAWGRPLGPVRPGGVTGGSARRPGLAVGPPGFGRPWHGHRWGYGYNYAYGLGGLWLGLGLGSLFGDPWYGDPWYGDEIYAPPIPVPPAEVVVETDGGAVERSTVVAACARRFKTYDPTTQTYVGKGHVRRHCP